MDVAAKRVLIDVCLGMRESEADWLALGRGLTARGLACPLMVICDGARAEQRDRATVAQG